VPAERVLVLDAQLRHSLAIVRSLGRVGVEVVAAAPVRRFPSARSRHVAGTIRFDARRDGPERLLELAHAHAADVVIAAGLPGNELLCRHRSALEGSLAGAYNDLGEFERLANKRATVELAATLGVATPVTVEIDDPARAAAIGAQLGYPLVFKSAVDQGTVRYPRDGGELNACVADYLRADPTGYAEGRPPLVQQYVDGDGHGFFGLADRGRLIAHFMHRRLHEVPPTGGPSAMAMSWRDPALRVLGERFFAATGWHGVAMVEFKRARRDGVYYLIEVNPKFWGSLDLAIASGVDFPALLLSLVRGQPTTSRDGDYRDDVILRSLTMDLAYAVARRDLRGYVRAFGDRRVKDDLDLRDPLPTTALFATGVRRALGSRVGRAR